MIEYVTVLTAGGPIVVDATASEENGYFEREAETAAEVIAEVRRSIRSGEGLLDDTGRFIFIANGAPLAYSYYRKGG